MAPQYKYMTAPARRRAARKPQLEKQPNFGVHPHYKTPNVLPAQKTLYMFFSGQNGGFFLPFSVMLSLLPDGPKDVLAIRSNLENFFLDGVEELGSTAYDVANALRTKVQTEAYNKVVVFGFSAGSFFAVRVAEFLAADVAVSFAGVYPDEGFRIKKTVEAGLSGFDSICACRPMQVTRLVNVVSTKCESDVLCSQRLKNIRPALMTYHLVNSPRHDVLTPMLNSGCARLFMRVAVSRNGMMIRLISGLTSAYGLWVVRPVRQLFGLQKVASWYLANKKRRQG